MVERQSEQEQIRESEYTINPDASQPEADDVLVQVHEALRQRGHDPVKQMVGYLLSGDPAYITEHSGARTTITELERDHLLGKLVAFFLEKTSQQQ